MAQTGREPQRIALIKEYLVRQGLFRNYETDPDLTYTSVLDLDLSTVLPCVSGPKRPHDYVSINNLKEDWNKSLTNAVGFKGFGLKL